MAIAKTPRWAVHLDKLTDAELRELYDSQGDPNSWESFKQEVRDADGILGKFYADKRTMTLIGDDWLVRRLDNHIDLHSDNKTWANFLKGTELREGKNGWKHYISSNGHYIVSPTGEVKVFYGYHGQNAFDKLSQRGLVGKAKTKTAKPKQEVKLVSPAADLQWSEPKAKLEKIADEFRKYYGKKVTIYGGGGAPPSTAILQRVELHPTILKGKDGYTLKAYVKGADSKILPTDKGGDWDFWLGSWQIAVNPKQAGKSKSDDLPSGLSIKKVKGGYEVIHTKSGSSLMPFAYPERELATDFARRAGQVGVDWTRPFPELQKESEKIADLIRGGKKPGMFEKVLDMPTTFPSEKESELQSIHDSRSPRSKESDERQSNADTIDPDDSRVEQWVRDQGRMDVIGIDTPRKHKGKKVARKTRKSTRTETQVRRIRR